MRKRFEDASNTAAPARHVTLDHQPLAHVRLGDHEIVDIEIVVVLRVRNRRFQTLANILGDPLLREFEIRERHRDLLAADQLGNEIELLRAHAQHTRNRFGLVVLQFSLARALTHGSSLWLDPPYPAAPGAAGARFAFRSDEWP